MNVFFVPTTDPHQWGRWCTTTTQRTPTKLHRPSFLYRMQCLAAFPAAHALNARHSDKRKKASIFVVLPNVYINYCVELYDYNWEQTSTKTCMHITQTLKTEHDHFLTCLWLLRLERVFLRFFCVGSLLPLAFGTW